VNRSVLSRVQGYWLWGLRLGGHYGSIEGISTIALKLNKEYKPLTVAIFLVVGGILISAFFASSKSTGVVEENQLSTGSSFIPQAQGAEVDSAALAVQDAPFVSSVNNGATSVGAGQDTDILYSQGALKDPGSFVVVKVAAPSTTSKKQLLSGVIYQVVEGDTLQSIASSFGVPKDKIVQFNPSVNFSTLDPGISILIPGSSDINVFAN
jgi:LysM repeat protein